MTSFVEQYMVNVAKIRDNPPSDVVGVLAQNLYANATKLLNNEITLDDFDRLGYIEIVDTESEDVLQAKRSLNYIKDRIFKDKTGYYEKAKYDIPNEVKMNKEELVKLYGANKKFYAYNGILERSEIEKLVDIQFALQYYHYTTIIAVDSPISVQNFIEL